MADSTATQRITEEQLDELRKKHDRIKHVRYNGTELVFKPPTSLQCTRYLAQRNNPAEKDGADASLAQLLVIQADGDTDPARARDAFNRLLDRFPLMMGCADITGPLAQLTGVVQDDDLKK